MACTNLRPLYLLDILREETDEAHRLTVPQLVDALALRGVAVERKSLYRDIQGLVDYGADIRKTASGYYLASRTLLPAEVQILCDALRAAPFLSRRRTEELVARLGSFLSRHQAAGALGAGMGAPKAPDDEALRTLEGLREAIEARCQVSFAVCTYGEGRGGLPARRLRASPYALLTLNGRCFLACCLEEQEALSILPLSRISALRRDATPWRHFSRASPYAALFDAYDCAERRARFALGESKPLLLLCGEAALPDVVERLQPQEPRQKQADGRFLVSAEAAIDPALMEWLLSFGAGLEVLEPAELREALRGCLRAALAQYEKA